MGNSEGMTRQTIGPDDGVVLWHDRPGEYFEIASTTLLITEDGTLVGAELELARPATGDTRKIAYAATGPGLAPIGPPIRLAD